MHRDTGNASLFCDLFSNEVLMHKAETDLIGFANPELQDIAL